ncbi:MAG: hypothetical protein GEU93_06455 [Propionibacteriales bacterium]|nr:hypothetical protein [Propionibacteriales bacterium]
MQEIANHPLDRLFNAKSVAVIGASSNPARIGGRPLDFMMSAGYAGKLYPINPNYDEIQGLKCYPTIEDVPEPVDVAIVAVAANKAIDAIEGCGRNGVKYALMFTAGFAEVGPEGRELQDRLVETARRSGVRIIGPNSVGYSSSSSQIIGSFGSTWLREGSLPLADGSISFVTHSGAFGAFIYAMAQDSDVSFRHFVNVGNEVDLEFTEVLEYIIEDPKVKGVGGYIEGIKDGEHFVRVAHRANELGKPLVMIKVGRSERSQQAAASHTAALTGSDDVYEAIFDECNVVRVEDVQQMLDILYLCQHDLIIDDPGIAAVSISGGTGVWAADQAGVLGLRMADFTRETRDTLDGLLPAFGSSLNPVDATAQLVNDPDMLKDALGAIAKDPNVDLTVLLMGLQETTGERFAKDVIDVKESARRPLVVGWVAGPDILYKTFAGSDIPVYRDFYRPLLAIQRVVQYAERRRRMRESYEDWLQRVGSADTAASHGATVEEANALAEHVAKERLRELDVAVPELRVVDSAEKAAAAAEELGYPIVMKAAAEGKILHKTDLGVLKANLASADAVREAYGAVAALALSEIGPDAEVFVERQADEGVELIVSLLKDDVFGYYVVLGLGGELVELLKEAALHRAPAEPAEVARLLEEQPRILELLRGVRGRPPADIEALIDLVVRVSKLPSTPGGESIAQVELNPVRVHTKGRGASILDVVWTTS